MSSSSKDTAAANTDLTQGQAEGAEQQNLIGSTQPLLSSLDSGTDPLSTPFGKSLVTAGTQATSNAYGQAKQNENANAQAHGFGFDQPVTAGADNALGAQEAGALAQVPAQAEQEAIQPELEAAQLQTSQAGQFNPAPYYGDYTGAQEAGENASNSWEQALGSGLGGALKAIPGLAEMGQDPYENLPGDVG
jgi:hypothetical protein